MGRRTEENAGAVASAEDNEKLTHSDEDAPETTRDDALDAGVPMLPGVPEEPVGPEDALGQGDKRGDYRQRVGPESYHPHQGVAVEDGGEAIRDEEGNIVDFKPRFKLDPQRPRTEEIGDVPGEKGGVTTG